MSSFEPLPIERTETPQAAGELIDAIAQAAANDSIVYPIGGGTCLDYGLPAKQLGVAVSLAEMNRIVDYPARDMTVTVEAGATMKTVREALAAEGQQLPFDPPGDDTATLGGIVAVGLNGPRQYGLGSIRDYVIGIQAVDGLGRPFRGGGRVVKNVAGYDFCKLLTGSLGTIGVISELTFKTRPLPVAGVVLVCQVTDLCHAEKVLAGLVHSDATPSAIELMSGRWAQELVGESEAEGEWRIAVGLEGSEDEVAWMQDAVSREWKAAEVKSVITLDDAASFWRATSEFTRNEAELVLKAVTPPSQVTAMAAAARNIGATCDVHSHAGSGVTLLRFAETPEGGISRAVVGNLATKAVGAGGNLTILSCASPAELTIQSCWGAGGIARELMRNIKREFDPKNILNRGRFVFPA